MFFSIVVPVYNVEKYLGECVDSILTQSFDDFELILVDDGSRDESGAICDEYAARDSRVKVIHKENGGQSSARNMGIAASSGEFAVFLDSDDMLCDKNFLADVHGVAQYGADVVVFRYCKYFEDGHTVSCGARLDDVDCDDKTEFLKKLVSRDAFFCSCWSKVTRMSILKDNDIKFDESSSCEDMDWYFNVVSHASKFKAIDKEYVYYRQRANSVTSSFKKKSIEDYIFTIDKWHERFDVIEEREEREVMLSALSKLYCNLLIAYSRHMDKLKDCKKRIFAHKGLLAHNMNPRSAKIYKFSRLFGLGTTCIILNILGKMR